MHTAYWCSFGRDQKGQGLAEYSLIVAFASLLALAIFVSVSGNVQNLWSTASETIAESAPHAPVSAAPATASAPADASAPQAAPAGPASPNPNGQ